MNMRLSASANVGPDIERPAYTSQDHATGIVHIGVGAFHKAHQALYTDTALAKRGGDWRILGVSLRSPEAAHALNPQNGRYVLITRDQSGDTARLVASIDRVLVAPDDPDAVIAAIADPGTRIVTITVTEKAYGIDRTTGGLDPANETIAHDLAHPRSPRGAIGFLVAGLIRRKQADAGPLTILCCDNLPENGRIVSRLVADFAARTVPDLLGWIDANVRFPSSMVDRITPATTERTLSDAQAMSGFADHAAVETEPFSQWIIEDDFIAGRPAWDEAGALFVDDVAPYERMKLRLLNGAHSLIAYAGFLAGYETVADAMANRAIARLARAQMAAAAKTLSPVPGIDLDTYCNQLVARFSNGAIRHLTYQIAMDGTEKLPQRILAPLADTMAQGGDPAPFAFTLAAWMRYCLGQTEDGAPYDLRDPRQTVIAQAINRSDRTPDRLYDALTSALDIFPQSLATSPSLRGLVIGHLQTMLKDGMIAALDRA